MYRVIASLLILTSLTGCAHRHSVQMADTSIESLNVEGELGRAIHHQITTNFHLCRDSNSNQYVEKIGSRIAAQAQRQDLSYRVAILIDDRIYATHAPGGYVYVTTGMLQFLQNEIELAGVLAHEISALQYRDPRFSHVKKAMDLLAKTGSAVGPAFGPIGALSALGLVVIDQVVGREKDRARQVLDADRRALTYLVRAGFDPQGLPDILNRLHHESLSTRPYLYDYLESHPITQERINHLRRAFRTLPISNTSFKVEREGYLTAIQTLKA